MTAPSGARPIVALLTDFGTGDHYVGAMRGAILTVCPDATIVDVTHEVPPQDVVYGAQVLAESFAFFPPGTVFVAVVDPGVGTSRAGLAALAGGYQFVGPDNGILDGVFTACPPSHVVALVDGAYARPSVSRTFEGRDRFGPVAGWLAGGEPLANVGRHVQVWHRLPRRGPSMDGGRIEGHVMRIDHFGNLITDIERALVEPLASRGTVDVRVGGQVIRGLVETYAQGTPGEPCALFDSGNHLEIAVPLGHAADALGVARGDTVVVSHPVESPC